MTEIIDYISTWSVLKWVILVLVAGFIGQFGKMMAESIMAGIRRRRSERERSPDSMKKAEEASLSPVDVTQDDIKQKPFAASDIPDKKALKILAKARKKEAKIK